MIRIKFLARLACEDATYVTLGIICNQLGAPMIDTTSITNNFEYTLEKLDDLLRFSDLDCQFLHRLLSVQRARVFAGIQFIGYGSISQDLRHNIDHVI